MLPIVLNHATVWLISTLPFVNRLRYRMSRVGRGALGRGAFPPQPLAPTRGPVSTSGQYASAQIAAFATANGITRSMGKTGVCWDGLVPVTAVGRANSYRLASPNLDKLASLLGKA